MPTGFELLGRLRELGYPNAVINEIVGRSQAGQPELLNRLAGGNIPYNSNAAILQLTDAQIAIPEGEEPTSVDNVVNFDPTGQTGTTRDPLPEYEPYDGNILFEQRDMFQEGLQPFADKSIRDVLGYQGALDDMAEAYGDEVRGFDGYGQLEDYAGELQALYEAGGLTDVTKANLEASRRDADQWSRGQRDADFQDLAERGMTGGGMEVLANSMGRATAADRMSARDLETNAFAQEQALQALHDAGRANQQRMDIDRDIADTQLGLTEKGTDTVFNVNDSLNRDNIDAWKDIEKGGRGVGYDTWTQGGRDALPASQAAANAIGGSLAGGRGNVATTVGRGQQGLEQQGQNLIAGGAGQLPNFQTPPNPMPTSTNFGGTIGDGIGTVFDVGKGIWDNRNKDKDDDEPELGGQVGAGGNGEWGS